MIKEVRRPAAAFVGTAILVNGFIWANELQDAFALGMPPETGGVAVAQASSTATSVIALKIFSGEGEGLPEPVQYYLEGPKRPGW